MCVIREGGGEGWRGGGVEGDVRLTGEEMVGSYGSALHSHHVFV